MAQRPAELSQLIKAKALELGFAACGISKAEFLEEEAPRLEAWLKASAHGQMQYMENHFDKRLDPRKLVPGAQSVISFTYNYYTDQKVQNPDAPRISMYAFGRDYHKVVKKKAEKLFDYIREIAGHIEGRVFVDSAPVMDKAWARKSGLGWIGKHTNLIAKKTGSFFFIGEIIIDLPLYYDGPVTDHCGDCTKCMDACPTEAIIKPYVVDGSKCISYFTIELKEAIPVEMKGKFGNWVFGCDICQEVCPWNRFSIVNREKDFAPHERLLSMQPEEWQAMTEETFDQVFRGTPVMRTKYKGLLRNLTFIADP